MTLQDVGQESAGDDSMISEISMQMMRLLFWKAGKKRKIKGKSDYRIEVRRVRKNVPWIRI